MLRATRFAAIILTALALVPAGAHLFAMPNKLGLDRESYLVVQGIYRGWALFGLVLFGALGANLALALMSPSGNRARLLAGAGFALIAATLIIFFTWTFPANQATENWTLAPDNWEALRLRWEVAHSVNAVLTFIALCCVTGASLTRSSGSQTNVRSAPE